MILPERAINQEITLEQAFDAIEKHLSQRAITEKAIGRAKFFAGSANNFSDLVNFFVKTTHENYVQYSTSNFGKVENDWKLQVKLIGEILKSVEPFDDNFKVQFEQILAGLFFTLLRSYTYDRSASNPKIKSEIV